MADANAGLLTLPEAITAALASGYRYFYDGQRSRPIEDLALVWHGMVASDPSRNTADIPTDRCFCFAKLEYGWVPPQIRVVSGDCRTVVWSWDLGLAP